VSSCNFTGRFNEFVLTGDEMSGEGDYVARRSAAG